MPLSSVFLYDLENHEGNEERTVEVIKEAIQICRDSYENKILSIVPPFDISDHCMQELQELAGDGSVKIHQKQDIIGLFKYLQSQSNVTENEGIISRKTLLDLGDQLVALQLCLGACKQSCDDIWKLYQRIMFKKIELHCKLDFELTELTPQEEKIYEDYNIFATKCAIQDVVDFCLSCSGLKRKSDDECNNASVNVLLFPESQRNVHQIMTTCLLVNAKHIKLLKHHEADLECKDICLQEYQAIMSQFATEKRPNLRSPISSSKPRSSTQCSSPATPLPSPSLRQSVFYADTPGSCAEGVIKTLTAQLLDERSEMPENQLTKILLSYLRLLVNTRDEIALARVINVPNRDLDHWAFTDVRKTAHATGLPMFQTAVSFIRKIRLGGKGYAPGEECLLKKHVKGIGELVGLMNRLQGIVEEASTSRDAFVSILRTLRSALLKAKLQSFRPDTVEQCVQKVQKSLLNHDIIIAENIPKSTIVESRTIRGLQSLLEEDAMVSLCCDESQNRIPKSVLSTPDVTSALIHFPSLLTQFRTPEELKKKEETPKRGLQTEYYSRIAQRKAEQCCKTSSTRVPGDFEATQRHHLNSKRQVEFNPVQSSPKKAKLFDENLEAITTDPLPVDRNKNLPGIVKDKQFCKVKANEDSFKAKGKAKKKTVTKKQKKNMLSPRQKVMTMFFKAP